MSTSTSSPSPRLFGSLFKRFDPRRHRELQLRVQCPLASITRAVSFSANTGSWAACSLTGNGMRVYRSVFFTPAASIHMHPREHLTHCLRRYDFATLLLVDAGLCGSFCIALSNPAAEPEKLSSKVNATAVAHGALLLDMTHRRPVAPPAVAAAAAASPRASPRRRTAGAAAGASRVSRDTEEAPAEGKKKAVDTN